VLFPTHEVSENNSYSTGSLRITECNWSVICYVSIHNGLWFKCEISISVLRQIRKWNKMTIIHVCECLCIYEFNTWHSVIMHLLLFLEFTQRSRKWRHPKAMRKLPMFCCLDLRCKRNCLQTVESLSLSSCLIRNFQIHIQGTQCKLGIKFHFRGYQNYVSILEIWKHLINLSPYRNSYL
jgi:hypothetical protein